MARGLRRRDDRFEQQVAVIAQWSSRYGGPIVDRRHGPFSPVWGYPVIVALALSLALTYDRPWGWVGGEQVTALPDVCAAAALPANTAIGEVRPVPVGGQTAVGDTVGGCMWRRPDDGFALIVTVELFHRSGLYSSGWRARTEFFAGTQALPGSVTTPDEPQPRLGDDSVTGFIDLGVGSGAAAIVLRGNVVILAFIGTAREGAAGGIVIDQVQTNLTIIDITYVTAAAQATLTAQEVH